jgi:hypothetical protein
MDMTTLSVTPAGAEALERTVIERTLRPVPVMVQGELERLNRAVQQGTRSQEEQINALRGEAATVEAAIGIVARLGCYTGLPLAAALRFAVPALMQTAAEAEAATAEFVADPE